MSVNLEELYRNLLSSIGEDPNREGLRRTPVRAAHAFEFLMKGYKEDIGVIINNALFKSDTRELVVVKNIELYSMCEHHLLPFFGKCHVGYIPNGKVLGLSKVARVVDAFGRRLQIQHRSSHQRGHGRSFIVKNKHLHVPILIPYLAHAALVVRIQPSHRRQK